MGGSLSITSDVGPLIHLVWAFGINVTLGWSSHLMAT